MKEMLKIKRKGKNYTVLEVCGKESFRSTDATETVQFAINYKP